jgi:hypothetical protein
MRGMVKLVVNRRVLVTAELARARWALSVQEVANGDRLSRCRYVTISVTTFFKHGEFYPRQIRTYNWHTINRLCLPVLLRSREFVV